MSSDTGRQMSRSWTLGPEGGCLVAHFRRIHRTAPDQNAAALGFIVGLARHALPRSDAKKSAPPQVDAANDPHATLQLLSSTAAWQRSRDRLSHIIAIAVEARGDSKGSQRSRLLGRESPRQSMNISHHRRLRANILDLLYLGTILRSHDDRSLHTVCRANPQLSLVRPVKSNANPHASPYALTGSRRQASLFIHCLCIHGRSIQPHDCPG